MAKKILQIVQGAYRATLEEQDDTVLWLTQAMKGAGTDFTLVLAGCAVNYAVKAQDASGLAFGEKRQTQPPRLVDDLRRIVSKGIPVFLVEEDVADLGLEARELVDEIQYVPRRQLAKMMDTHDLVFGW